MEQARYWVWSKHKNSLNSHVVASTNTSYGDSWEEQAFAEDAAGPLGGCIWPPRSYTCSFCRREFKSAQALGGHMNVHRRDRARLKQSPSPNNELLHHNHTLSIQHPSQICNLVYNPNSDSDHVFVASPSSTSRVSVPPSQVSCDENSLVPPFSSQVIQEQHRKTSLSSPPPRSNLVADRYFHISDLKKEEKNSKYIESKRKAKEDYVTADLSVCLNLVVCSTYPTTSGEKEEIMTCKRRRTDATVSFFPKSSSNERNHSKSEVLDLGPNSIEDLDLELRLGDRPKVK